MGFRPTTSAGHPLDEVTSALQKAIRRGQEKEALYWALQLNERFTGYLWRRLVAIVVEDIGYANNELVAIICALEAQVVRLMKEKGNYSLNMLAYAVMAMARSPKSRESDEFMNEVLRDIRAGRMKLEVPDEALDMHTGRGKNLKRGSAHFWEHGAVVHPLAYEGRYVGFDPKEGDGWRDKDGAKYPPLPGTEPMARSKKPNQTSMFDPPETPDGAPVEPYDPLAGDGASTP